MSTARSPFTGGRPPSGAGRPPSGRADEPVRRSVVPPAASRSLWLAAVWTGAGAALVGAVVAIVAVAVLWLPAAGDDGSAGGAIRGGLITFVASLHGGVIVDGTAAAFLPLGLLVLAAVIVRRAGRGLADAAAVLDESAPDRLWRAGALQALTFAVTVTVLASASSLGTSSASVPGAFIAGILVFGIVGGTAFVRASPLVDDVVARTPSWAGPAMRVAVGVLAVYALAGALLVVGSLATHHQQVEALSRQVGGGWAGLPVLLLGVLAAPNAVVAGAAYLAGPGFAVGSGTTVALASSPHGRLPAFPVLGALPSGPAPVITWLLAVLTPLAAGAVAARLASPAKRDRWRVLGYGVLAAGALSFVLAWQAGGGIGGGRLNVIGASAWQFGFAVLGAVGSAGALALGVAALIATLRAHGDGRHVEPDGRLGALVSTLSATVEAAANDFAQRDETTTKPARATTGDAGHADDDAGGSDQLAG